MTFIRFANQNILDWSAQDCVIIALNDTVYLLKNEPEQSFSGQRSSPQSLQSFLSADSQPTSVKASPSGTMVAVGTESGFTKLIDVNKQMEVCYFHCHKERVCCLAFNGEHLFSSGSRDTSIVTCDIRQRSPSVLTFQQHFQEVCSLKWDYFSTYLASGGNDNAVYVWDLRRSQPVRSYQEHRAAVRALCWSPHQFGLLISGGGSGDKSIKYWNVTHVDEGSLCTIMTDSQVCNVVVSSNSNEMLTTHGFNKNQLMLWNISKRERLAVVEAHKKRVLHAALAPNNESIATCAADETLKFWKVFEPKANQKHLNDFDSKEKSHYSVR